jgi:hypothetical protein
MTPRPTVVAPEIATGFDVFSLEDQQAAAIILRLDQTPDPETDYAVRSIVEIVTIALDEHAYLTDMKIQDTLHYSAELSTDAAIADWLFYNRMTAVPPSIRWIVTATLRELARREILQREEAARRAADELADAIEHGDVDAEGNWIPYPSYRSV